MNLSFIIEYNYTYINIYLHLVFLKLDMYHPSLWKTPYLESGSDYGTPLVEEILTSLVPFHLIQFNTKLLTVSSSPRLSKTNNTVLAFKEFIESVLRIEFDSTAETLLIQGFRIEVARSPLLSVKASHLLMTLSLGHPTLLKGK